ncbi:endonuclease-reverse transcriptase [Elysia marginata]|uniref:Endonuclease-reverse transcriptase n=1 Tax=Elysia marginata TaxID=1093978 RepID=A0AAV4F512_9GAST|nr:endonuclease-reverse transcriptase [Elysia marginata]
MKKGPITCFEIEKAIAKSKSNRAPGEDRITADMLKADPSMSAKCLIGLFKKLWTEEKVPDAWKKRNPIKLSKKGDLSECNNWHGIDFLSVPGKIFCQVSFTESETDFCEGRSCIDQIFILRTIIEQSIE